MADVDDFRYIIVGAGITGINAVEGIRSLDPDGRLLLMGAEDQLPYNRPPLSKDLWLGRTTVGAIFEEDPEAEFWGIGHVQLELGASAESLDVRRRRVLDSRGNAYRYEKLLLATGGAPRRLDIVGGELYDLCYYRTVDDYRRMRYQARPGRSALVVGGGFIGSEMAAAFRAHSLDVTMIFPGDVLFRRLFPAELAAAVTARFRERGIHLATGDVPVRIEARGDGFVTTTLRGARLASDLVLVGVGLAPEVALAQSAKLLVADGVVVDEYLRTSDPRVYAAGDNALFPCAALGGRRRVDHWDNAVHQGRQAGRNMAGAGEPYTHMPYFSSELFGFAWEAVGDLDASLETVTDWLEPNATGTVFYLRDGVVRGVMLCNQPGRLDAARELIRRSRPVVAGELRGSIIT